MKRKDLYFWIDRFQIGGLEKSIIQLYDDLNKKEFFNKIIIFSLDTSGNSIKNYFESSDKIIFKFHKNYFLAYLNLLKILRSGNIVFSFKNHIPLILISFLTKTKLNNLFIRHSNSILSTSCLLRYKKNKLFFFYTLFFRQRLRLLIQNILYSLVPNHICNSLENLLLIELFTMRKVYCYTNPCYLEDDLGKKNSLLKSEKKSNYKAIWFARYSYVKDIKVLFESVKKIDSLNKKIKLDIYTSNKELMRKNLIKENYLNFKNLKINLFNWKKDLDLSNYDLILITSLHEGLSNSFMEAVIKKKNIIAPLTSSGFLENISSNVYLYRPGSSDSFVFTFKQALFDFLNENYNNDRKNQYLFNQEFYQKLYHLGKIN